MRQILLRVPLPGTEHMLTLYGYGLAMCLGFLVAILVAARRARRLGQSQDVIYNCALLSFFGGIVGARLFFVVQYSGRFPSLLDLIKIWEGGLTFYGGLILAALAVVGYLRLTGRPVLYWLDIMAPSMALGEGFGRLGCFLNGCCYGDLCHTAGGFAWPVGSLPWQAYAESYLESIGLGGATVGGADGAAAVGGLAAAWHMPAIQPAQLYALVNAAALFVLLWVGFGRKRRHGQVFFAFILLYAVSRFLLEYLRADEAEAYLLGLPTLLRLIGRPDAAAGLAGLTISQNVAALLAAASVTALVALQRSHNRQLQADYVPLEPRPRPAATEGKRRKEKRS